MTDPRKWVRSRAEGFLGVLFALWVLVVFVLYFKQFVYLISPVKKLLFGTIH